jgi:predicted RNA-binding protein with PUA-like domain
VDLKPLQPLKRPVTLEEIKASKPLENFPLIRQSRLSVMPVTPTEYRAILALAKD